MLPLLIALSMFGPADADVRVTNSHLVVVCVAGQPVDRSQRRWQLSQPTSFTFTMRNEPRGGIESGEPGLAVISFAPEAGHKYEIEVRGDASSYSRRVWERGAWKPVVRDRTTNAIVSGDPQWIERGCR